MFGLEYLCRAPNQYINNQPDIFLCIRTEIDSPKICSCIDTGVSEYSHYIHTEGVGKGAYIYFKNILIPQCVKRPWNRTIRIARFRFARFSIQNRRFSATKIHTEGVGKVRIMISRSS